MTKRLLDRQVSLVEYMTSGAGIFGGDPDAPLAPALRGIDLSLLRLEAHFSYAKRMEKIKAVYPKTFELLGSGQAAIVRAFVETCPPRTISRLDNARQFHRFLSSRWMRAPLDPPYISDVAACELACAELDADDDERMAPVAENEGNPSRSGIRRSPAVVLRRCAHDVRPIFETGADHAAPVERDTPLVFAQPPGADSPQVFEVIPAVFDLLAALSDWTDPGGLDAGPDFAKFLADMAARGLIEVRP
ncbi:hypothetical protein SBBP2_1090001 [Burkholderiales bacterium]|nr:hypothetical protein SBBP2_1090001 [Burkholderiales bacterium]